MRGTDRTRPVRTSRLYFLFCQLPMVRPSFAQPCATAHQPLLVANFSLLTKQPVSSHQNTPTTSQAWYQETHHLPLLEWVHLCA